MMKCLRKSKNDGQNEASQENNVFGVARVGEIMILAQRRRLLN